MFDIEMLIIINLILLIQKVKVLIQLCILACFFSSLYAIKSGLRGTYSTFFIVNANSSKCLNIISGNMFPGNKITQETCEKGGHRLWMLEPTSDGFFYHLH